MLKILWVSHFLPYPPKGGLRQRTYHLFRAAAERHRVHLVALNQQALLPEPAAREDAVCHLRRLAERLAWFPLPSDRSRAHWGATAAQSYFSRSPFDVNWLRSAPMHQYVEEVLRAERFDVIHLDTIGLWPYAGPRGTAPVVLNHHNIESEMMARRADKEPSALRRHYFRRQAVKLARLERRACPAAASNLVVSPLDAERLRRMSPTSRVRVIPNGVDVDYFRRRGVAVPERHSMVFAGGMNWYPNRDAVVYFLRDVWPVLARSRPERTLTIVGKQPPGELLEATRDPRIRAPGFVDDVRPYLEAAAAYVCPIRDGGGTRLKVLDALAMEKPLVASALAVEGLDLVDEVHYLKAETPEDYARQLARLDGDPNLGIRLGSAGRELVERRYGWQAIGEQLVAAYEEASEYAAVTQQA